MKKIVLIGIAVVALVAALWSVWRFDPMHEAGRSMLAYLQAKRQIAQDLEAGMGVKGSMSYRLVAVTGPQWRIGDAVDPDNLLNPRTDACVWPEERLPREIPWSGLPEYAAKSAIDLGTGLPVAAAKALRSPVAANANLNWQRGGRFAMRELSQRVVPETDFKQFVSAQNCQAGLDGHSALIVRGVVYGKEVFGSLKNLSAGAKAIVETIDPLTLTYQSNDTFELEDKDKTPKLFVVSLVVPSAVRGAGSSVDFVAPSKETVDALEALSVTAAPKK